MYNILNLSNVSYDIVLLTDLSNINSLTVILSCNKFINTYLFFHYFSIYVSIYYLLTFLSTYEIKFY